MDQPSKTNRTRLVFVGLVLASVSLYLPTLGFDFVGFDDEAVLLSHPSLYDESSIASSLREIFVGYFPREEPLLLRDVSWALDARLFGFANPFGYHLGNVLLNALNVGLLFLFIERATRRFALAFTIAALFAVLPIHVEPVSWIMGRKDVLSACFILCALLAQQAQLRSSSQARGHTLYALGLLFTGLALLSKMGAIACVIVLALHRIFHEDLAGTRPREQRFELRSAIRATLPGLVPHALLTVGVTIWYTRIVAKFGVTGWRGLGPSDPEHLANVSSFAPLVMGGYLRQIFLPRELSMFYRWPHVEIPLSTAEMTASVALAGASLAALIYCCMRRRDLAFYLLAFGAFMAPYLGIVYVGFWSADRYAYLASFCLLAVAVTLVFEVREQMSEKLRPLAVGLLIIFALSSTAYTLQHQFVWQDDESLWSYEAYREEPSLLSIQALAKLYTRRGEAEPDAEKRAEWIEASLQEIARGFERERALGRVDAPYATSEQLQLSMLHYLLGRLERLTEGPIPAQIQHFETSHAIAPTRANTLMLAGAYYDLAQSYDPTQQEELVRRSLDYFIEHVDYTRQDSKLHEQNMALLTRNYEERFPFLRNEIHEAKESMLQ